MLKGSSISFDLNIDEAPDIISSFKDLLGKDFVEKSIRHFRKDLNRFPSKQNPNFWAAYFTAFDEWYSTNRNAPGLCPNKEVIELILWAKSLLLFEYDWKPYRKGFLSRLKSNRLVKGLLFESKVGMHYLSIQLDVQWIFDPSEKKPTDLKVYCNSGECILVECTEIEKNKEGDHNLDILVDSLMKSLDDKKESKVDWGHPRVIAIQVPEWVNWEDEELEKRVRDYLEKKFIAQKEKYRQVGGVFFSSFSNPLKEQVIENRTYFVPDRKVLAYSNPNAIYRLPIDLKHMVLNT